MPALRSRWVHRRGAGRRRVRVAGFCHRCPGEPNRLYVVEQGGRIRILEDGQIIDEPFLDISDQVSIGNEQGLLSAVFHPDYESNDLFYVDYTDVQGNTRVVEYRDTERQGPVEKRELLYVPQPYPNHNGGQLAFGPDGLLYVGMGDGGSGGDPENRAQDLSSRLGKMLRIDADDPKAEWEMFAYGLRNPWRFSFDRVTGDLWIGDVGQSSLEEIDFVSASRSRQALQLGLGRLRRLGDLRGQAADPGWEPRRSSDRVQPRRRLLGHRRLCLSGREMRSEAWGRYFYGDYCSGRIWSLARMDHEPMRRGHPSSSRSSPSFAEDLDGELYALSSDGVIYRFVEVK